VYSQLLRDEAVNYFGSPVKILQFVLNVSRASGASPWWPWCWFQDCWPAAGRTSSGLTGCTCLSALPALCHCTRLGRFSIITFWLAVITMWLRARDETPPGTRLSSVLRTVIPERLPPDAVLFGVGAALILEPAPCIRISASTECPRRPFRSSSDAHCVASWRAWSNANAA